MTKKTLPTLFAALVAVTPAMSCAGVAFNGGAATDHRDRGISQTLVEPALHGGTDYSSPANGKELGRTTLVVGVTYNFQGDGS